MARRKKKKKTNPIVVVLAIIGGALLYTVLSAQGILPDIKNPFYKS